MYLALDLGLQTGWARWEPGLSKPVSGIFDCGSKDKAGGHGGRSLAFYGWLLNKIDKFDVTHVAIEAALSAGASNKNQNRGNEEWQEHHHRLCEMACVLRDVPYIKIDMRRWRKHFIGRSLAPKGTPNARGWLKNRALSRCKLLGWEAKTHDQAEALGILDYFRATQSPSYAVQTTDLFNRAN